MCRLNYTIRVITHNNKQVDTTFTLTFIECAYEVSAFNFLGELSAMKFKGLGNEYSHQYRLTLKFQLASLHHRVLIHQ